MTDNSELKRLAEAATPGPWSVCGEVDSTQGFEIVQDIWNEHGTHTGMDVVVYEWSYESDPLGVIRRPDADFIAAANPETILALIAENERLRVDLKSVVRLNNENADLFKAKNDQLRAEVAGLRTGYEAYEQVNAELKAEVEGLRGNASLMVLLPGLDAALEDLEVYGQHSDQGYRKLKDWYRKMDLVCKAIDAALGQGEQS